MELWSKTLWLHIVCPNVSHTSAGWILMCLERRRLKSKTRSVEAARKCVCGVGWGGNESENRKHGKEWKIYTVVPGTFFCLSLPHSPSFFFFFFSGSLEACQLESWLPPRELEGRGCAWSRRGRLTGREKMRWEGGRVTGGLNNELT